jgi:hypothetical protein
LFVPCFGDVRLQLERPLGGRECLVQTVERGEHYSLVGPGKRKIGFELQRALVSVESFPRATEVAQCHCSVVPRRRWIEAELQALVERSQRFFVSAESPQRFPPAEPGLAVPGAESEDSIESSERLVIPSRLAQRKRFVVQRLDHVGLDLQRLVVHRHRRFVVLQVQGVGISEIEERFHVADGLERAGQRREVLLGRSALRVGHRIAEIRGLRLHGVLSCGAPDQ